jgi:hypothetical protein
LDNPFGFLHHLFPGSGGTDIANEYALSGQRYGQNYAPVYANMGVNLQNLPAARLAALIGVLQGSGVRADRVPYQQLQQTAARALNPQTIRGY